jgi:uncharacterized protein YqjF (DUF2071 family)
LRRIIPSTFELDTYQGQAWIGVIPFEIAIRPRGLFPFHFFEVNVRTYVSLGGKPGVYFFSLDASSRLAVWMARRWFHLPYFDAGISMEAAGDWVECWSRRQDRCGVEAELRVRYRPVGPAAVPDPGSLADWLTGRYCLYTRDSASVAYRCDIRHEPWLLQPAEAEIATNTMTAPLGLELPASPPLLHFSRRVSRVLTWNLEPCGVTTRDEKPGQGARRGPGGPPHRGTDIY